MRFVEFGTLMLPVTNEEQELLDKLGSEGTLKKRDLTEREQVIANDLVTKSIIIRKRIDDGIIFKSRKTS